jgi:hypothetical protein
LQFFAGFEAHGLPGRNAHFRARPGIAADSGFAGSHVKDTKATQFNAVACGESLLHGFEHGLDSDFRLGFGDAGAVDNFVDYVKLYQTNLLKIQELIVISSAAIVKNFLLHYAGA